MLQGIFINYTYYNDILQFGCGLVVEMEYCIYKKNPSFKLLREENTFMTAVKVSDFQYSFSNHILALAQANTWLS